VNRSSEPVIAGSRLEAMRTPATLLLALLLAVLAACSDADLTRVAHPSTLAGTTWEVVSVNGQVPGPGSAPTAAFAATEVTGSAGCNSYGGHYRYDPSTGEIAFTDLGMTAMLCVEPARNRIESAFSQAIGRVSSASIDPEGRLVLSGPQTEIVLTVGGVGS
jgi:heat shock protein HslJ